MDVLKQLREGANLTQEVVAVHMNVSTNTIQNWEREDKISKESLHKLLDLYKVDSSTRDKVVLFLFGDSRPEQNDEKENDNFPYFLFTDRPGIVAAAKKAVLSAEEMEVFGYDCYVNHICKERSWELEKWPLEYAFFEKNGGFFTTMQMIDNISDKLGELDRLLVYDYGKAHPEKSFNFLSIDKELQKAFISKSFKINLKELYKNCKLVEKGYSLTEISKEDEYRWPIEIKYLVEVDRSSPRCKGSKKLKLRESNKLFNCISIDKYEKNYDGYTKRKAQYLSDKKTYDEHPDWYDKEPSFTYEFEYGLYLTDIGKKFVEWYES